MTRRQKDPLRALTEEERKLLVRISRSHAEPASTERLLCYTLYCLILAFYREPV
jgi:hypothetical protein